uniref:Amidase domain-containing protein n=1 Tax=Bionectria ochroleuca TaxID=29856 RepID=A0A8H7TQA1_BIOOC
MGSSVLIQKALKIREDSIDSVLPGVTLPDPLPQNVQGIPDTILNPAELQITGYDTLEIVQRLASRELSCESVTKLAQKTVNCITELLPEHAIKRAKYLDSLPHPTGPLHGLPISIKEQFGFEKDQCGAIIFARTSQPQSVMHLETNNNIYGRTVNPFNRNLTAGGSSGGEGALVGFHGSPHVRVGGDIGGSIRVPAANCGIYGFKPTPFRVGNPGGMGLIVGQERVVSCSFALETNPAPQKLKIGVMWSDGIVNPHPPITRALSLLVNSLESNPAFEIVDWKPIDHDKCWDITCALYWEDGGRRLQKVLRSGNEAPLELTQWLLEQPTIKPRTVEEALELKEARNSYRAMYNQHWLNTGKEDNHPVDAILSPVGPGCAPPHNQSKYWSYTSQWKLLEYPSVSFQVTKLDPSLDVRDDSYRPISKANEFNYELYPGPEAYEDAPASLQLNMRRYEDEKCIDILKKIEAATHDFKK